jgi:hypothetical protein
MGKGVKIKAPSVVKNIGKGVSSLAKNAGKVGSKIVKTAGKGVEGIGKNSFDIAGAIAKGDFKEALFGYNKKDWEETYKSINKDIELQTTRNGLYNEISSSVDKVRGQVAKAVDTQAEMTKEVEKTAKGFDNQKTNIGNVNTELLSKLTAYEEQAKTFGKTQSEMIKNKYDLEISSLNKIAEEDKSLATRVAAAKEYLAKKFVQDAKKARLEELKAREDELKSFVAEPLKGVFSDNTVFSRLSTGIQNAMARGVGGAQLILQGAKGASKLLGSVLEQVTGIPGVGALFEMLAQGPEQVRAMVVEFTKAIPDIIVAVLDALPVLIETLAENLDEVVIRLVDKLAERAPDIVVAIAKAIVITLPIAFAKASAGFYLKIVEAAGRFVTGAGEFVARIVSGAPQFISNIVAGAGEFVMKILDGAVQFTGKIIEGAVQFVQKIIESIGGGITGGLPGMPGGGLGDLIKGIGSVGGIGGSLIGGAVGVQMPSLPSIPSLGFAEGGLVPSGFPNDSFPARLTSGEAVIDRTDNNRLSKFLDRQEAAGQNLTVNISIGEDQLAKVLLNLNRRGFRTA